MPNATQSVSQQDGSQKNSYLQHCRSIQPEVMLAANRLGRGMQFHFTGADNLPGILTLRHQPELSSATPVSSAQWAQLRTACGVMWINATSAEACLNLFSAAPFTLPGENTTSPETLPWFLELYNQHLYPDFRQLFGQFELLDDITGTSGESHELTEYDQQTKRYELTWQHGQQTGTTWLIMESGVLEQWYTRQKWQPASRLDVRDRRHD